MEKTAKEVYHLNRRRVTAIIIGIIYEMAPGRKPRSIGKIVDHIVMALNTPNEHNFFEITKCPTHFSLGYYSDPKQIKEMVKYALDCKEFIQLNISNIKWRNGQREPDEEIVFTDRYSDEPEVDTDFIDLDACIGNITCAIQYDADSEGECFLCKYAKKYGSSDPSDSKVCATCANNPNYGFHRVAHPMSLVPHNSKVYQDFIRGNNIKGMEL